MKIANFVLILLLCLLFSPSAPQSLAGFCGISEENFLWFGLGWRKLLRRWNLRDWHKCSGCSCPFARSFVHGYISAFREKPNNTMSYNLLLGKLWERGTNKRSAATFSGRQFGSEHRPWLRGLRPQPRSCLPSWHRWEAVCWQYRILLYLLVFDTGCTTPLHSMS